MSSSTFEGNFCKEQTQGRDRVKDFSFLNKVKNGAATTKFQFSFLILLLTETLPLVTKSCVLYENQLL